MGTPTDPVLDHHQLAMVLPVQSGPRDTGLPPLIAAFIDDASNAVQRLIEGLAAGDRHAVVHEAHSVSGVAAMFGLARLAATARRVEDVADEAELDSVVALVPDLRRELAEGLAALKGAVRDGRPQN